MNNLKKLLIFTLGVSVGSVVTWKFVKDKYERLAQEEIDSVKKVFSRRYDEQADNTEERNGGEPDMNDYTKKVEECGYTKYSDISKKENTGKHDIDKPYVITPEEYGELDYYQQVSLTYFADGVLADELNEPIEDIEDIVGSDSLNHFGEYEDDSVFVRNDRLKIDYEILMVLSKYSDVRKKRPHNAEV